MDFLIHERFFVENRRFVGSAAIFPRRHISERIITALHAVIDRTGTSSGRTWVVWVDTHQETKSGAGDYLMRLSHNGTVANDGVFTIADEGRMPVLFNFEKAIGGGCLTDTTAALDTQSGAIAVKTPAGTKYIPLYDH